MSPKHLVITHVTVVTGNHKLQCFYILSQIAQKQQR